MSGLILAQAQRLSERERESFFLPPSLHERLHEILRGSLLCGTQWNHNNFFFCGYTWEVYPLLLSKGDSRREEERGKKENRLLTKLNKPSEESVKKRLWSIHVHIHAVFQARTSSSSWVVKWRRSLSNQWPAGRLTSHKSISSAGLEQQQHTEVILNWY